MRKYEGTNTLLQVLIGAGLLGSAASVIGGLITMAQRGGGLAGLSILVTGVVGSLGLIALAQVGRAISDIARNSTVSADLARAQVTALQKMASTGPRQDSSYTPPARPRVGLDQLAGQFKMRPLGDDEPAGQGR